MKTSVFVLQSFATDMHAKKKDKGGKTSFHGSAPKQHEERANTREEVKHH